MGEDLTRWTIRLALAAYVTALVLRIRTKRADVECDSAPASEVQFNATRRTQVQRVIWALGCCLAWAHVASAFAFYHHWSHDDAYLRTARQTAETVGIDWGGGIYFNYLFLLLWTGDVAWWWLFPAAYRNRPKGFSFFLDGYLAFISFNAIVVFGQGAVRYLGLAATGALCWLVWSHRSAESNS